MFDIVGCQPMLILLRYKFGLFFNVDLTLTLIVTNYGLLISISIPELFQAEDQFKNPLKGLFLRSIFIKETL
jgi:hypothetical protein